MSETPISPLRRRMIEDMSLRNFGEKTQHDYIGYVKTFSTFLGRSPATATPELGFIARPLLQRAPPSRKMPWSRNQIAAWKCNERVGRWPFRERGGPAPR